VSIEATPFAALSHASARSMTAMPGSSLFGPPQPGQGGHRHTQTQRHLDAALAVAVDELAQPRAQRIPAVAVAGRDRAVVEAQRRCCGRALVDQQRDRGLQHPHLALGLRRPQQQLKGSQQGIVAGIGHVESFAPQPQRWQAFARTRHEVERSLRVAATSRNHRPQVRDDAAQ
jgi:hypothetical protein